MCTQSTWVGRGVVPSHSKLRTLGSGLTSDVLSPQSWVLSTDWNSRVANMSRFINIKTLFGRCYIPPVKKLMEAPGIMEL